MWRQSLSSLRNVFRRGGREAEGAPLLREYGVKSLIEGSNPSLSAINEKPGLAPGFSFMRCRWVRTLAGFDKTATAVLDAAATRRRPAGVRMRSGRVRTYAIGIFAQLAPHYEDICHKASASRLIRLLYITPRVARTIDDGI